MIPLSIPNLGDAERDRVAKVVADGWVSSAGPDIAAFEQQVADYCGTRFGVGMSSGTAALHLAFKVLETGPEDLVLAPNLTFVASLNAVAYTGATPILVDVDRFTGQMDLDLVEAYLEKETEFRDGASFEISSGKRIRAILAVHVLGYSCDMDRLLEIARARGIPVVEDAAEALGSRWKERSLGSFGLLSALSFNGNKIITTGSGGMLLSNDQRLSEHARHLSTQAKSFSAEYVHDEVGYNYRMANLNAALGLAQMERLPDFLARKQEIYFFYATQLADLPAHCLNFGSEHLLPNFWLFTLFTPQARQLEDFLTYNKIQCRKLWVPMNRLPMYRPCRYLSTEDHSHRLYEQSLSLPCSTGITDGELETVAEKVVGFLKKV
ncbi:MAG: aminotransferase class I/II-fold pyridoxal phosphate-dependent enzyme [Bacteroidota bacterium]